MFIKNINDLPPNLCWIIEEKAKILLNYFPEISRRVNKKGYTEIAFVNTLNLRNKIKELST